MAVQRGSLIFRLKVHEEVDLQQFLYETDPVEVARFELVSVNSSRLCFVM
jgi:hypothetical protein